MLRIGKKVKVDLTASINLSAIVMFISPRGHKTLVFLLPLSLTEDAYDISLSQIKCHL